MKKFGLALLILAIGVRISGTLSPVEGQSKPGSGFAAVFLDLSRTESWSMMRVIQSHWKRSDIFLGMFHALIWPTAKIRE